MKQNREITMSEKKEKLVSVKKNSCSKGKRVERKLAHWFHAKGLTARRSQQYAGNSADGDADVIVEELPSFHIESKGTTSAIVRKSMLDSWYKQVQKDVRAGKVPIIFHIANGKDPVALIPDFAIKTMALDCGYTRFVPSESITPSEHTGRQCLTINGCVTSIQLPHQLHASVFAIKDSALMYICDPELFLELMKSYEEKVRVDQTVTGLAGLPISSREASNVTHTS